MNDIPTRYNPQETEDKWYKFWEENNLFCAKPNPSKKPFSIVIPPPNVTGILHMGHALNNTIQDILIRYHRMKGYETLWVPGTDHAGIATQNVVEKAIAKEGLRRQDLGREKFVQRVWQWREQYGSTIINQLKKLGASCDWSRTRFTMDEEYSKAVIEVFVSLYQKGLIYRGDYIINWCPRCQTALSDEEAPYQQVQGKLYYLRYPLKKEISDSKSKTLDSFLAKDNKNEDYIVVATTRPETMLADTAVAVNPKDKRFKRLVGKTVILPLMEREIPIIADDFVDPDFGTGIVKVTPAHDPNDYQIGKRHNLEFINIMRPDGLLNENAGKYQGLERYKAREMVLQDLQGRGLVEKIQEYSHSVGHCYRCHTIIEPYFSKQWFVKMKPLAKPAIEAVKKGKIKFYPKRWTKVYLNWMENIQDWCISRQIWWGHRLPVYYCKNCLEQLKSQLLNEKIQTTNKSEDIGFEQKGIIVSRTKPSSCPVCGSTDIYQDEDVLDTWFSSWLWPFATFGWPFDFDNKESQRQQAKKDLEYFYPTSVLVTAQEIIFFWVARMIMAGLEFMKGIPFRDVYIHGTVRDITGKKMSKSLGNIIDPLDIIKEYGCDALRFSLISLTATGQDVFLAKEKFEAGRNFANKIWNASRFILMNLNFDLVNKDLCLFFKENNLTLPQRWILSSLYESQLKIEKALSVYRLNEAINILYDFFWHKFCDWYLEIAKLSIKEQSTQLVLYKVLEKSLRMLHPFMPFITEEIWQRFPGQKTSISMSFWPHLQKQIIDREATDQMQVIIDCVVGIRNLRAVLNITSNQKVKISINCPDKINKKILQENCDIIKWLCFGQDVEFTSLKKLDNSISSVLANGIKIFLILGQDIDKEKEIKRLSEQLRQLEQMYNNKLSRLKNKEFLKKAPEDIVSKEKESLLNLKEQVKKLKEILYAFR